MMQIAILGSTGAIGKTTLKIINKDKKNFKIILLSTNKNAKKILEQAKKYKVKNVIISNKSIKNKWEVRFKQYKIKTYDNFDIFKKIFKKKLNYVINAISGIEGLSPTIGIIKFTKKIAIANKESIICGWNLINKELKKNKTKFIPVDSEHFSIYKLLEKENIKNVKEVIITASGGPFLKKSLRSNKIKVKDALKHPNWKMGKKITIDSSTLVNKVFETIEAKKIFNLNFKKLKILINPNSYVHAIIIFKNGTIKILAHETNMDIPIFNSIYDKNSFNFYKNNSINLIKINNLNLSKPNIKKFYTLNILNKMPPNDTLFETILISVNDELVNMFLNKKINYEKISFYLMKIIKFKIFKKYYNIQPKSVKQIYEIRNFARGVVQNYVKENYL